MKVYTKDIAGHTVLCYAYSVGRGADFLFHLECEVGETYRKVAKRKAQELAAKRGRVIQQVELDCHPWVVEALVKAEEPACQA